ncbi:MAG: FAD-binding oxidoreductase [Chloroflexi bacterium]|nr:MAG: FAD-binding oxidoreductase [Chloroflexota bacterium]
MESSLEQLQALLGDGKVSTSPSVLEQHGRDENFPEVRPPLAVAYAESREDVQTVLEWCRTQRIPLIPFGAGTSLEGALVPAHPGVPILSLDLSRMNQVVSIQPDNFLAVVQPGITRTALNEALRYSGLFFPVDPGADASLGGMAATNASGTTTVRYGGMRQNTVALEVVLANGEVLRLGRPVRKTSSGYDLKDLFIGSAGTLGVITELTVQLHPVPEHIHTLRVFFPSILAAAQAAYAIMASALPVARMELVDELGIQSINRYMGRGYTEQTALFLEFHSSTAAAIEEEVHLVEELVRDAGATDISIARTQKERTAQWEARHHLYWAIVNAHPGHTFVITDTAVPLVRLPELIAYAQQLLAEMDIQGSIIGHVGDGNFHTIIAARPEDYAGVQTFSERLVRQALAWEGTASGEHGIGLVKRGFMVEEHGASVEWMRRLKALFDPDNLLNPGKLI